MIKTRINNEYKDIIKIFGGGTIQKEIIKVWSGEAQEYVYESEVEYTGTLPITITANGNALLDYRIYGNTVQTGTPTPESPVDVVGCGERTENLFDEDYANLSITIQYRPIYVGIGYFTLSTTIPFDRNVANVFLLSGDVASGASTLSNGAWLNNAVTAESVDGYVTVAYRQYNSTGSPAKYETMLNPGSTALPYEPYGYKLPMTVSDGNTLQNVPVYIGENQLAENEYVSFSDQKIYKDVSGTLTPTAPPVPFPDIPTIDGETVIDYDGDPKPSQMYIKYRR